MEDINLWFKKGKVVKEKARIYSQRCWIQIPVPRSWGIEKSATTTGSNALRRIYRSTRKLVAQSNWLWVLDFPRPAVKTSQASIGTRCAIWNRKRFTQMEIYFIKMVFLWFDALA
jgi:hypothetical protein